LTNVYFQDELRILKQLAVEFSLANPALAPLLEGETADPDVERLLEAVAFQNSMLRRKLDVDFPELIKRLAQLILPHYPRPLPASSVVAFQYESPTGASERIPVGAQVASPPLDGVSCRFSTTRELDVHPLELLDIQCIRKRESGGHIRLSLALLNITLDSWHPERLHFFINGDHATACELYLLLCRYVERIIFTPDNGGAALALPPHILRPVISDDKGGLFPYPANAFPGYRLLQEYFYASDTLLFFELSGWDLWQWRGTGTGFSVTFEIAPTPLFETFATLPSVTSDLFALNAVPVVNIFNHQASPILLNHRTDRYLVRPSGPDPDHYRVLSVDRVTGFCRKNKTERPYQAFELFGPEKGGTPLYQSLPETSPRHGGPEMYLSVVFPEEMPAANEETLSIELTCTNGSLPEQFHTGDISVAVSGLPEEIRLRNITAVTPGLDSPPEASLLWRLTSHLYLNYLPLARLEHLQALLKLYVFEDRRNGVHVSANLRRIAGIESLEVVPAELIVDGIAMKGREIRLGVCPDHFAGSGDLFLFGCVLDVFFAGYASMNTFTRLVMNESTRGRGFQWPARLGNNILS